MNETTPPPSRPREKARKLVSILVVCVPIVVFGIIVLLAGEKPEMLPGPPVKGISAQIKNGAYYWFDHTETDVRIWSAPVTGGPRKLLTSDDYRGFVPQDYGDFRDDGIYWEVSHFPPIQNLGRLGAVGSASENRGSATAESSTGGRAGRAGLMTGGNMSGVPLTVTATLIAGAGSAGRDSGMIAYSQGSFLASNRPPENGERRTPRVVVDNTVLTKREMRRVSYGGGKAERLHPNMMGQFPAMKAFTHDGVYWIPCHPSGAVTVETPGKIWTEFPAKYDLMFSNYDGSPPLRIAHAIYASQLFAGNDYVFWTTLREYPDRRHDLHCIRFSDHVHTVVPDYTGMSAPVEFAGRLYWFEPRFDERGRTSDPERLMSDIPDGADRRVEFDSASADKGLENILLVRGRRLYVFLHGSKSNTVGKIMPRTWIAELIAGSPGSPRILRELPIPSLGGGKFDGDYVYFSGSQRVTSMFDWLYSDSTTRMVNTYHRIRIFD